MHNRAGRRFLARDAEITEASCETMNGFQLPKPELDNSHGSYAEAGS
jgi:hypothetical protein